MTIDRLHWLFIMCQKPVLAEETGQNLVEVIYSFFSCGVCLTWGTYMCWCQQWVTHVTRYICSQMNTLWYVPLLGSVIRDDNLLPLSQGSFNYCTKYKVSSPFYTVYSVCSRINTLLLSYVHFAANNGDRFRQCLRASYIALCKYLETTWYITW